MGAEITFLKKTEEHLLKDPSLGIDVIYKETLVSKASYVERKRDGLFCLKEMEPQNVDRIFGAAQKGKHAY